MVGQGDKTGQVIDLLQARLDRAIQFERDNRGGAPMPGTGQAATQLLTAIKAAGPSRLDSRPIESMDVVENRLNALMLGNDWQA